jgi:hypothetical protein
MNRNFGRIIYVVFIVFFLITFTYVITNAINTNNAPEDSAASYFADNFTYEFSQVGSTNLTVGSSTESVFKVSLGSERLDGKIVLTYDKSFIELKSITPVDPRISIIDQKFVQDNIEISFTSTGDFANEDNSTIEVFKLKFDVIKNNPLANIYIKSLLVNNNNVEIKNDTSRLSLQCGNNSCDLSENPDNCPVDCGL